VHELFSSPRPSDRTWMGSRASAREARIRSSLESTSLGGIDRRIFDLIDRNREIHDRECINLNPASNVMNPRAEAVLSSGLTTRASLGHPGEKYEMGLEAIEEIEVIASELARAVFHAEFAELRVGSGALANLYSFMATCEPGDTIVVPPATIGGHVTHRRDGAAGLYRLDIHEYPIDPSTFSVDLDGLTEMVDRLQPKLVTVGTSLNLLPHPVAEIRQIADRVGASVLFDAAHACGMIAGGVWPNPLDDGADLMTMSTYKSLGGPAGGIVLTNRSDLAGRLDAIAYPGLTANFDVAVTTALAITLLDWLDTGPAYAQAMVDNAVALACELEDLDVPIHTTACGHTHSHHLVADATRWGGGGEAAERLRRGNLLASAIGLPGNESAGLRLGTPEITRIGMTTGDMPELADLIATGLRNPDSVAQRTTEMRQRFDTIHFVRTQGVPA
jgi:glycine hydroxymethyltransferase